jgi:hypothetical protein
MVALHLKAEDLREEALGRLNVPHVFKNEPDYLGKDLLDERQRFGTTSESPTVDDRCRSRSSRKHVIGVRPVTTLNSCVKCA